MVVFVMALNGQRPPDHLPVNHTQVAADIETLHRALKKREEVYFYFNLFFRNFLMCFQISFFEIAQIHTSLLCECFI